MSGLNRPAVISSSIPESVRHLDVDVVREALFRNSANVTDTARELGVYVSDLRKLCFAFPRLMDVAFEHEEARLDLAEKRIDEALRSDDSRRHDSAAQFVLKNTGRAKRRGFLTATGSVDIKINSTLPPREVIFTWRPPIPSSNPNGSKLSGLAEEERRRDEDARRSWNGFEDDDGGTIDHEPVKSSDDCREGEVTMPAVLIEHQDDIVTEPELELEPFLASPAEGAPAAPDPAVRRERERIDAWIRNCLVAYPLASCLRCRTPIVGGAAWEEVSNGEARARFHRACHAEWRTEWEAAARQALGLEG